MILQFNYHWNYVHYLKNADKHNHGLVWIVNLQANVYFKEQSESINEMCGLKILYFTKKYLVGYWQNQ